MLADWFARLGPLAPSRPTMALFETSKKKRRGNWITIIFSIEIKEAGLPVGGNRRLPPAMLFFHHQTCKNIYQKEIISYANDAGPRKKSPAVTLSLFYSADKVAACVPLLSHPPSLSSWRITRNYFILGSSMKNRHVLYIEARRFPSRFPFFPSNYDGPFAQFPSSSLQ